MNSLKIYCISLNPNHLDMIKKLGYTPVGLGESFFSPEWINDKTQDNIAFKNSFYGEYTFHYWLWKNKKIKFDGWIGFCQYRKFWRKNHTNNEISNFDMLQTQILTKIPDQILKYDTIIGEEILINQFRFSKFVKHNFKTMISKPSLFFNKKKRNIKFHFDMMHGEGNLDRAIKLLPNSNRNDFNDYVNSEISFNPHNMFICKNKEILYSYYESLFPWLLNCEKIFGFKGLKGFGLKRIYGFLAERYMSYWFRKYTKYTILPIHFRDINDFL